MPCTRRTRLIAMGLLSTVLLLPFTTNAKKNKFFPGCHEIGHEFVGNLLVLKPDQLEESPQTLYFIHNVSNERIKIQYNQVDQNSLYPLWETSIDSDLWASFATDKQGISFKCLSGDSDGFDDEHNCGAVLEVCQFPRSKFAEHNRGNYWITSNKGKYRARSDAIRYGILLRW